MNCRIEEGKQRICLKLGCPPQLFINSIEAKARRHLSTTPLTSSSPVLQ